MVSAIAPAATSGEPAIVTESLLRIGTALERGLVVDRSLLRWPAEPLRSAILDALTASELADKIAGRVAAVAVVLSNIVDMVEAAWSMRRRIERGQAQAGPVDARSAVTLELLWEPLALRWIRAQAGDGWRWVETFRTRERAMSEWLRAIEHQFITAGAQTRLLLELLRTRRDDSEVTRLERELSFERRATPVAPPNERVASVEGRAAAYSAERARARARERALQLDRWTQRALEGVASDARWVRRKGTVFVCVEHSESGDVAQSAAVAAIACASAIGHDRRCVLITSDETIEETAIDSATALSSVISAVRRRRRSRGLDAVRRAVASSGRVARDDSDVVLAVPGAWLASDAFEASLRPLHDELLLSNGRIRLLRPSPAALQPFGYDFDGVYLLETSGILSDAT